MGKHAWLLEAENCRAMIDISYPNVLVQIWVTLARDEYYGSGIARLNRSQVYKRVQVVDGESGKQHTTRRWAGAADRWDATVGVRIAFKRAIRDLATDNRIMVVNGEHIDDMYWVSRPPTTMGSDMRESVLGAMNDVLVNLGLVAESQNILPDVIIEESDVEDGEITGEDNDSRV